MAVLAGPQAPWAPNQLNKSQTGSISRKVQHYGYVFDYETANVLRDRSQAGANCPPMPALQDSAGPASGDRVENGWGVLAGVVEKTRKYKFDTDESVQSKKLLNFPELNQLTVNQYKVGEGIGSHVDTPSAFGDGLISISLNSGIVMEFRKVDNSSKKQVYLPPRSLVLMSGAARYEWAHNIITRRTDTHNGIVLPRSLRLSLTLRSALSEEGTALPLIESSDFPPTWGSQKATSGALVTPATERDHVHAVYDAIATQWHHTRGMH